MDHIKRQNYKELSMHKKGPLTIILKKSGQDFRKEHPSQAFFPFVLSMPQAAQISSPRLARMVVKSPCAVR